MAILSAISPNRASGTLTLRFPVLRSSVIRTSPYFSKILRSS